MDKVFSFNNLIPNFQILITGTGSSSEWITAAFVACLIAIGFHFFLYAALRCKQSFTQVRFYFKLLEGLDQDELAENRQAILEAARKHESYGNLWREFNESLVASHDRQYLYNTLDAAHFFNTHSLSRGLTENRLLAAVPGFLTALGVIGTFAGLQMGLTSLGDIGSADVQKLREGIGSMISGAAIAFLTSVWGIGLSVLFNLSEKLMERWIRKKINELQNRIDYLYPRINAEQSLVSIADHSQSSAETLQGLAEKIGDKMQEAMAHSSETIRTSLEESLRAIMAPAIESLVDNANSGSEKALESLMTRFMAGFGDAGEKQSKLIEDSSMKIQDAADSLSEKFAVFLENADKANENNRAKDLVQREQLQQSFFDHNREANEHLQTVAESFSEMFSNTQNNQEKLDKAVSSMLEDQKQISNDILEKYKSVMSGFTESIEVSRKTTSFMHVVADKLDKTSKGLDGLCIKVDAAASKLGTEVTAAVESTKVLAEQNQKIFDAQDALVEDFKHLNLELKETTEYLHGASVNAKDGFIALHENLDKFKQSITQNIEDLYSQVDKLLLDYSQKVNSQTSDRLNHWNQQTSEFTETMKRSIGALATVVDEIDLKLGVAQ